MRPRPAGPRSVRPRFARPRPARSRSARLRSRPRLLGGLATAALLLAGTVPAAAAPVAHEGPAGAGRPTAEPVDSTRHPGRTVALTFDDGPHPVHTPRLLEVLRAHRVTAVFCLWGDHVEQHPGLVRAVVADGHTLCNHSMHHDDMAGWPASRVREDLARTSAAIRRAAPGARIPYFRAPYGSWGGTPEVAARMGMQPLGWRLAVTDWEPPGTGELVRRIREGLTEEAVVLLHDGGGDRSQTVEAVDRVIPELRADGWRFDLPARRG